MYAQKQSSLAILTPFSSHLKSSNVHFRTPSSLSTLLLYTKLAYLALWVWDDFSSPPQHPRHHLPLPSFFPAEVVVTSNSVVGCYNGQGLPETIFVEGPRRCLGWRWENSGLSDRDGQGRQGAGTSKEIFTKYKCGLFQVKRKNSKKERKIYFKNFFLPFMGRGTID